MRNTQKNQVERRFVAAEMRVDEGRIEGYAAVFNEWSEDLGGFREKIRPGAFAKTLQEADVRALFNHDSNYVLGRNRAGTLELAEDTRGLHFRVTPPETTWAADLLQSVRRGDINQASFGFRTIRDEWKRATETGDIARRELIEVELYDVSPVTFPAYPATSVQARSLDMLMAQIETVDDPDALHALRARLDALLAAPGQEPHPADDERNDQTLALMRWQLQLAERS